MAQTQEPLFSASTASTTPVYHLGSARSQLNSHASNVSGSPKARFTLGPKAGINYSTLVADKGDINSSYRLGYHAGAFFRFTYGALLIQPEVMFSAKRAKLNMQQSSNGNYQSGQYNVEFNNIDIPWLVGVSLVNSDAFSFRLYAGPMASFNISGKGLNGFIQENKSAKDYYEDLVWGYQAGLGFDFGNITLDGRYEGGFTGAANFDRAQLGKPKSGLFQASLGIKLF